VNGLRRVLETEAKVIRLQGKLEGDKIKILAEAGVEIPVVQRVAGAHEAEDFIRGQLVQRFAKGCLAERGAGKKRGSRSDSVRRFREKAMRWMIGM